MLTPLQAAKAVNLSKASIHRAIKCGKLSAVRQEDGAFLIDPAELYRVFEPSRPVSDRRCETVDRMPETHPVHDMQSRIAVLEAELRAARDALSTASADRDAWRDQAQRLALPKPTQSGLFERLFRLRRAD